MYRNPVARRVAVLWVAVLLVLCSCAVALAQSSTLKLGGTWSGKYSGSYSGTFTLKWIEAKSKLAGTIALSKPKGTYGVTGSVSGTSIKFGAVTAGAKYTGAVSKSGTTMSGSYTTADGGKGTWSATKEKKKK